MKLSWSLDAESMGLAVLAAGDSAAFLSGMNPSIFTIRHFQSEWSDGQTTSDIRTGMVIANVLAMTVGWGSSVITKSWWPIFMTAVVTLVLDASYEWALRNPHK